jgi:hemoglobin
MKDIENRQDLELFTGEFYNRLLADPSISYIFTDVAKIDLEEHLPRITDFWELSIFHTGGYKKNVMQVHLDLNAMEHLTDALFDTWLCHFNTTADDLFVGPKTEILKTRALSISFIMKTKIFNT